MRLYDDLLKYLERSGWDVARHAGEQNYLAWYLEIWTIDSRWSPHGFTLFLTFLLDPRPGGTNPFWAIGTCSKFPEHRTEAFGEPSMLMTPNWINDLPQFVDRLNALRQSAANSDQPVSQEES